MLSTFKTIFELHILHNFYTELKCADFDVFPVSATNEMMRDHTALFRSVQNTSRVLILADKTGTTAANPIASGSSLLFGMKLSNPAFSNFTNEYPSTKKIFLFTNAGNLVNPAVNPVDLTRSEIFLGGPVISHTIVSNADVILVLKDANGTELMRNNYAAGSDGRDHRFDMEVPGNNFYTVTEIAGVTSTVYTYYSDIELVYKGIFGLIQIINQPAFLFTYNGAPAYRINFTSRTTPWSYYVVAPAMSGPDITNHLQIVDVPPTGNPPVVFTKTYPVPAGDKTAPLLYKDTSKVALFTSNSLLPYRQLPRKRIELRKNGSVLISDMPNPDVQKPGAQMFIYV